MDRTDEAIYRRLAKHLDRLPDGFPPSESGADLRVLARLFTPEEAELAVRLKLEREDAATIASRAELSIAEVEDRLEEMAEKGLIFSVVRPGRPTLYQAVPFAVGIFEFQVNALTPEFLADLGEYAATRGEWPRVKTIPQLRTIPIGESLDAKNEVLPYEKAEELVNAHDRFAVAPCLCRTIAKMAGTACDAPIETCMFFGDWADYYVNTGRGRRIDRAEVFEILRAANESNLVLQPSNTKEAAVICFCCGCCCDVLGPLKERERPADEVASAFRASYDASACIACGRCVTRCQMDAITPGNDRVELNEDRCIGCGLCVSTCPTGAIRLVRKEQVEAPPETIDEMWYLMERAQTEGS